MELRERVYVNDDLWEFVCRVENNGSRFEQINPETPEMSPTGEIYGQLEIRLGRYLDIFNERHKLGRVTADTGYYQKADRANRLAPDIAIRRVHGQMEPPSEKVVPVMPDLAVEIVAHSNTMPQIRRKSAIYLQHGSKLVWKIIPNEKARKSAGLMRMAMSKADSSARTAASPASRSCPALSSSWPCCSPIESGC